MPDLVLFPYLTLDARVRLGPWELIPRHLFIGADAATPDIFEAARKHIALYRLPTDDEARINRCGCFARPSDGQIGAPIDRSGLRSLHLALVAALLDQNPSRSANLPNAAHFVSTSDNCLLFGHPINADGSVAVDYGFMVNTILGGLHAGDDSGAIFHPAELHLPLFGCVLDAEYGDRLYGLLTRGNDLARRLATAIEWLDLAWRNTNSIHKDTRIVALRSGFEVLLNVGQEVARGRAELSRLLDAPNRKRPKRAYTIQEGKDAGTLKEIHASDLEWWFTHFVFLRNKIAHGIAVTAADYEFNGQQQLFIAEERLRQALKKTVSNECGEPELLLSPRDRHRRRVVRAAVEEARREAAKQKRDPS